MPTLTTELSRIDHFFADGRDAATLKRESRKITDDAVIWPVARAEMRHPGLIRERMAGDLAATTRTRGWMDLSDLLTLGWTEPQIAREAQNAARAYLKTL